MYSHHNKRISSIGYYLLTILLDIENQGRTIQKEGTFI